MPPDRAEPTPSASPLDPLAHLEHLPAQVPDRRGARIKRPSCYVQRVLAGEGTPSRRPTGNELPRGVPRASIVEVCEDKDDTAHFALIAPTSAGVEPKNEAEACGSPDWPKWHDAMCQEIRELEAKSTWQLVSLPPNANIVGSRWTYHIK